MAHSVQVFKSQSLVIHDLDLIVIVMFSVKRSSALQQHDLLEALIADWETQLSSYGPGIIDLKLPERILSDDHRNALMDLLRQVETELSDLGTTIPASLLNSMVNVPGVIFCDYQVEPVVTAISSLKSLILT